MSSVLRSVAVFSFVSFIALMSAPGCSQQGEGERCDKLKNGDLDCDDGLVCVESAQLADQTSDRCCAVAETDRSGLCTPSGVGTEPPSTAGTAGTATGTGGAAGAGSDAAGGTSAGESAGGVPGSSGSGTNGGVPSVDGGAPAAGANTGGAGNSSSGGQGGAD